MWHLHRVESRFHFAPFLTLRVFGALKFHPRRIFTELWWISEARGSESPPSPGGCRLVSKWLSLCFTDVIYHPRFLWRPHSLLTRWWLCWGESEGVLREGAGVSPTTCQFSWQSSSINAQLVSLFRPATEQVTHFPFFLLLIIICLFFPPETNRQIVRL